MWARAHPHASWVRDTEMRLPILEVPLEAGRMT